MAQRVIAVIRPRCSVFDAHICTVVKLGFYRPLYSFCPVSAPHFEQVVSLSVGSRQDPRVYRRLSQFQNGRDKLQTCFSILTLSIEFKTTNEMTGSRQDPRVHRRRPRGNRRGATPFGNRCFSIANLRKLLRNSSILLVLSLRNYYTIRASVSVSKTPARQDLRLATYIPRKAPRGSFQVRSRSYSFVVGAVCRLVENIARPSATTSGNKHLVFENLHENYCAIRAFVSRFRARG